MISLAELLLGILAPLMLGVAMVLDFLNITEIRDWKTLNLNHDDLFKKHPEIMGKLFRFAMFYLPILIFEPIVIFLDKIIMIDRSWVALIYFFAALSFFILNLYRFGLNFYAAGWASNYLAASLNNGKMPATVVEGQSRTHQIFSENTILPVLGDWIQLGDSFISPGDILFFAGALLFFLRQWLVFRAAAGHEIRNGKLK